MGKSCETEIFAICIHSILVWSYKEMCVSRHTGVCYWFLVSGLSQNLQVSGLTQLDPENQLKEMDHLFKQQQNFFISSNVPCFSPLYRPSWVLYKVFPLKLSMSLRSLPLLFRPHFKYHFL